MKTEPGGTLRTRLIRSMAILTLILLASLAIGLLTGRQHIDFANLLHDPLAQTLFFRLRLPRVLLAALIGASLSLAGAALQALFRNPLADPFTLGVSGGGALGATLAIALGWGARLVGIPLVYVASFAGAMVAFTLTKLIARSGDVVVPGTLLLAGVAVNLVATASLIAIQYVANPESAQQILGWIVGSIDVVGLGPVRLLCLLLLPGWLALLALSRQLHLLAIDEDTAATLGVNVARCENLVHVLCSFVIGITAAAGGNIGFVGLIVPHTVRILFGEDLRVVLPGSLLLGAAFLVLTDGVARTLLPSTELPVGAITGLLGGVAFLWLLRRRQQYSVI